MIIRKEEFEKVKAEAVRKERDREKKERVVMRGVRLR